MAQNVPDEIGNPYDWTEFYWGGFQPSLIGAVPIIDAHSPDKESIINIILDKTRKTLNDTLKHNDIFTKNEIKFEDYFVTIHDEYGAIDNQKGKQKQKNADNDNQADDEKNTNDDKEKDNESKKEIKSAKNSKDKQKKSKRKVLTVARLWHKNCFIGVRGSGKANPGQFNFIARFEAKTAKLYEFVKWED